MLPNLIVFLQYAIFSHWVFFLLGLFLPTRIQTQEAGDYSLIKIKHTGFQTQWMLTGLFLSIGYLFCPAGLFFSTGVLICPLVFDFPTGLILFSSRIPSGLIYSEKTVGKKPSILKPAPNYLYDALPEVLGKKEGFSTVWVLDKVRVSLFSATLVVNTSLES